MEQEKLERKEEQEVVEDYFNSLSGNLQGADINFDCLAEYFGWY